MSCVDVLNRLLVIHNRSLPMYLHDADPWVSRNDAAAVELLDAIVVSQREFVDRLGEMILSEGGSVHYGEFPMQWTAFNDVALSFLLPKLVESQRRDIARIEDCVVGLDEHPMAKALAQEALGAAKAHLDALEEVV